MSILSSFAAYEGYYNNSYSQADGAAAGGFFVFFVIFAIVLYLITGFFLYKVFEKAGRPGWAGFVPIYNGWVLFEISGKPGWWILFALIPWVGGLIILVLSLLAALELAKRFGKSQLFAVLGLWLFSIVGYGILAFDNSKYRGVPVTTQTGRPKPNTPSA